LITVYRIGKRKYSRDALSGSGGLFVGGRWHHKGVRIVYCPQHLSLASLEFLVHFQRLERAIELVSFDIEIPESLIEQLPTNQLPSDWNTTPPASSTADIGTDWLRSMRSAVLRVLSVLSSGEYNFLLNPAHPAASQIKVVAESPYRYDSRLWKT